MDTARRSSSKSKSPRRDHRNSNRDPKSYSRRDRSRHAHVADNDCSTSQSSTDNEDEHNFMALTTDGPQPLQYAESTRGKSTPLSLPHAPLDDSTFFGPMNDTDACLIEREESMPDPSFK